MTTIQKRRSGWYSHNVGRFSADYFTVFTCKTNFLLSPKRVSLDPIRTQSSQRSWGVQIGALFIGVGPLSQKEENWQPVFRFCLGTDGVGITN